MATVLKVIKSKAFKANDTDQTHFTCAHKGRVFGVSTLRFEDELKYDEAAKTLTISGDVEVLKNQSVDQLTGEVRTYLDLVPKSGMVLADF